MNTEETPTDILDVGQGPHRLLNVLILDDRETDRVRIRRLLDKAGLAFTLYEAEDLASFRAQIDRAAMDLVFLDYHLAIDTGLDALKILAGHEEQVGALPIMVTSVDRSEIAVEAMRSGCADYLIKEQLSVESIRKSVISAFERKILFSAIAEAQSARHVIRTTVMRFARTCGPEIRSVLSATLRHARSLRGHDAVSPPFSENLDHLEQSCNDIFDFLAGVADLLDTIEAPKDEDAPRMAHG